MTDFKKLIDLIEKAIADFNKKIPGVQQQMLDTLRNELRSLNIKGGNIAISAENVRKIADIKTKLQNIVLDPRYIKAVQDYVANFQQITVLQNQYFEGIVRDFSVPAVAAELRKQAVQSVVEKLTESGIHANVTAGVDDILRLGITTGGSYSTLLESLQDFITDKGSDEGKLLKYTKQITTDAINQYSAEYTNLVSNDLGFEWYRYSGSNIETTRPFCLACVKRRWIHVSEFPAIIKGDFPEFAEFDGKLYKGLPAGMYPETNESNFTIYRGGYNCGHQLRPVSEGLVPIEERRRVYSLPSYKQWAISRGITPKAA